MFVLPDNTVDLVDIDAMDHMESEYGIFMSDAGRDLEKLDRAKQLSQAMIQNGMKTSEVLDLFDTENFVGIKAKIRAAEKQRAIGATAGSSAASTTTRNATQATSHGAREA